MRELPDKEEVKFVKGDICELIRKLKQEKGKDIWICGGASIVKQLLEKDLIDRFQISLIPVLLGSGISLFPELEREKKLRFLKSEGGMRYDSFEADSMDGIGKATGR